MDFNYEIINEEFENDKVWVVILKSSTLTTLKIMVEFDPNPNLNFFICQTIDLSQFQMKLLFPNIALNFSIDYQISKKNFTRTIH